MSDGLRRINCDLPQPKLSGQERRRIYEAAIAREVRWNDPATWPDRFHFTQNGGMHQVVDVLFDQVNKTLRDVLRIEKVVQQRNGTEKTVVIFRKVESQDDVLRARLMPEQIAAEQSVGSIELAESVATPGPVTPPGDGSEASESTPKTQVKRPGSKDKA